MTPRTLDTLISTHTRMVSGRPAESAEVEAEPLTADGLAELEAINIY